MPVGYNPLMSRSAKLEQLPPSGGFLAVSAVAAGDAALQAAIGNAVMKQYLGRQTRLRELADADALRTLAGCIRRHALDHLDYYLRQLTLNVQRNGGEVHFAADAVEAQRIVLGIAERAGCRRVIKSKSMVSEELGLLHAMEAAGLEVVETDLGEFIVQISGDRPSHIVAPIVHKNRAGIATLFGRFFSTPYNDDPRALTMQARAHLRQCFRAAEMGMTGANFLVAETGQACIVENEGNARQSMTTPRVLVCVSGIEKVVPRLADLAVLLKLLARSATGQHITVYTSLVGGPRAAGEKDGPEQFHLVLVDAGRIEMLGGTYREALCCIRCGACLNACPVYRKIGGHAYGHVYSGPIGAVIAPLLEGLERHGELPQASSLCGACLEACPVKIDLPRMLVDLRRDAVSARMVGWGQRTVLRLWGLMLRSPLLYRVGGMMGRWWLRRRADADGWITRLPGPAAGWTHCRDMPAPAAHSFASLWRQRGQRR